MGASGLYQEEVNKEKSKDVSLNTEGLFFAWLLRGLVANAIVQLGQRWKSELNYLPNSK
jgi:hypothetical protein